jgi:uncharacterized cupin superfamily protein
MNKYIVGILRGFFIMSLSAFAHLNYAESTEEMSVPEPIRLDQNKIDGKGLTTMGAPWPKRTLVSGVESHRFDALFAGQLVVSIYDADDGLLKIVDYPFDEFVHVLHGRAILTAEGAASQTFEAGDTFVVPKGFTGTWEMQDNFRELIVIEKAANDAGLEILFGE